jgi:glycine hydroxymethyltransferase
VQLDLRQSPFTGKDAEDRLAEARMTVNRNTVPFDERPPTIASGVRIGSPAGTMRGLDAEDFREVGHIIGEAVKPGADLGALGQRTEEILRRRPLYASLTAGYATVPHVHE